MNIPSIRVKLGDEIALKVTSLKIAIVLETFAKAALDRPEWLHWDVAEKMVKIIHLPDADQVPFPIDVQQVVEYYSNRI